MSQRTILIVDDEPKITEVIESYLQNAGYRTMCAYGGKQALELFDRISPALVVLDLMLPDLSGENVCRAIRAKSRTPVIMLTAKVEEENILKGLAIGADDYVTKPFSPRQLVARVEAVLRRMDGGSPLASELSFQDGELVIDALRHEVRKHGEPVPLTPNEFNVVMALAGHPAKTFTREELIASALGDAYEGYERTIDTHIKNIRQKMEEDPKAPRYILTVYGVGYKFGGGNDGP